MAFAYLSYPYGLQPRPQWHSSIDSTIQVYDPDLPLREQIGRISDIGEKKVSDDVLKAFGLPQRVLFSPAEDIFKWESPLCSEQVWRDAYFLIRSSVVLYAGDIVNFGDMSLDLSLAKILSIPIVAVTERVSLPPQVRYLADVVVSSDPQKLLPIVKMYLQAR